MYVSSYLKPALRKSVANLACTLARLPLLVDVTSTWLASLARDRVAFTISLGEAAGVGNGPIEFLTERNERQGRAGSGLARARL